MAHYLFTSATVTAYDEIIEAIDRGRAYSDQYYKDRGIDPKLTEIASRKFEPYQLAKAVF